jgi:protein TonB
MQSLIQADEGRAQEVFVVPIFDATMPEFIPVLDTILDKPEPIDRPDIVLQQDIDRIPDGGFELDIPAIPDFDDLVPPTTPTLIIDNSSMIPMVRATPAYPSRALQRGIEGFVVVSFTVDAMGNVKEPTVTYAEPKGFFERAAL